MKQIKVLKIRMETGEHHVILTVGDTTENRYVLLAMQRNGITPHEFSKLVGQLQRVKTTYFCIQRPMEGYDGAD